MTSTPQNASICDAKVSTTPSQVVSLATRAIRLKQVQVKTGMSRSSIYAKSKAGEFPPPIKLGSGRSSAWLEHEVELWLQQQIYASRGNAAAIVELGNLKGGK